MKQLIELSVRVTQAGPTGVIAVSLLVFGIIGIALLYYERKV